MFDFGFDETLLLLRESVCQFAEQKIAPLAAKADVENAFPAPLWRELGAMGLLGITADEEYGGAGMGYLAHCVAMEAISRASASVGLSYGAHSNLCVNHIQRNGNAAQCARYLPTLISGEHVGALAMSEPSAGSDVVSMRTTARKRSDRYLLNGRKMWITNGWEANVYVIYAKTSPEKKQHGITAFIVERDTVGFHRSQKLDKLGMRGSNTCELVFEDCEVPLENVLGEVDAGVRVLMSGLDYERLVLSAGPLGIIAACLSLSTEYAKQRHQFGHRIGDFQLIQGKLADMYTAYSATAAHIYTVAAACDRGHVSRKDCAAVILAAAERATQAALDTIQILGGNGYINDYPAGRLLRDAKLYEIGAGTSEIRRLLIGRELIRHGI